MAGADVMLKSCKYCGKIHKQGETCPTKSQTKRTSRKCTEQDNFRNTIVWQRKRKEIRERDLNCCRLCLIHPAPNARRINTKNLSIHHIIPLVDDFDKRLDDDNLITLCSYHHELAECGKISEDYLRKLAESPPGIF